MGVEYWFLLAGVLLVVVALGATLVERLPMTTAIVYLAAGFALGPSGFGILALDLRRHGELLEHLTEVAVLVSLFAAGLKLRLPLADRRWWLAFRLAGPVMVLTVAVVAATGMVAFGLPVGAAVLLGAVLAPTDPVLASDVSVADAADRDRLRFALTGEAGLNDGTAFPFVMLGLGLLGAHDLGTAGWRWAAVDVLWATAGGLTIGWVLGTLVGRLVVHLRRAHRESVGSDDFLGLGLIALAYAVALVAHAYGFLAVFAAGLALRRVERDAGGAASGPPDDAQWSAAAGGPAEAATHAEKAPAYMAAAVLGFNGQLERVAELLVVGVIGVLLASTRVGWPQVAFAAVLLGVIRPLAVLAGLWRTPAVLPRRRLIAWFGIRGVGSVYYLAYAANHGFGGPAAERVGGLVVVAVAASVVAHGVSVTPLMRRYYRR